MYLTFPRLFLLFVAGLLAGGVSLPQSMGKEQDYGEAFEKLVNLGLPDAKGAKYIKITMQAPSDDYYDDYYSRQFGLKRKGDAWLLPGPNKPAEEGEKKAVPRNVIRNQYDQVQVVRKAKRNALIRLVAGPKKSEPGSLPKAQWKEVDLEVEIKAVIKTLDDLNNKRETFEPDQWRYSSGGVKVTAKLLVLACHTYRSGNKKLGNQLAEKILTLVPTPEKLIDSIVGDLADREYQQLFQAFMKNRDWKAYHAGVLKIVEKFPRGWGKLYGVKMLAPKLEDKIKGVQPVAKKFPGITPHPAAVKALDDLLKKNEPINLNVRPVWLINDGTLRDAYGSGREKPEPWLKVFYDLGMDSIPALASVAADEVLMATTLSSGDRYDSSGMISYGGGMAYAAQMIYENMERPCSRGEIARKILLATIPDSESELSSLSPEEFQETVIEWWKRNKKTKLGSLAKVFMEDGNSQQKAIALQVLITSGRDENASIVEEHILGGDSLVRNISLAEMYLKARKGKGKAFLKRYITALKDELEISEEGSSAYYLQQAGGLKKLEKKLSIHVQGIKPNEIIRDIRLGRTTPADGMPLLQAAIGKKAVSSHLPDIIGMIADFKNTRDKLDALRHLSVWISTEGEDSAESEEQYDKYLATLPPLLGESKSDWKKLLSSRGPIELKGAGKTLAQYGNPPSEAHFAAKAMEDIYFPDHAGILNEIYTIMTVEQTWSFILKRANELLDKGADAYFPDPENVTEERQAEIRTEITPMKVGEIMAYREKLTLDEKLAWAGMITGFGEKMPDGVSALSRVCGSINWSRAPGADAQMRKVLADGIVGKRIDEKLFASILKIQADNDAKHPDLMIMIQPTRIPGQSVTVHVWNDRHSGGWKGQTLPEEMAVLADGNAKSLKGFLVFGMGENARKPKSAVSYQPALDAKAEKDAMDKLFKLTLDTVYPKKAPEGDIPPARVAIIMLVETAENLKKKAAEEDDE